MKKLVKGFALGMALAAATAMPAFAQEEDPCAPVYQKFLDNYKGDDEKKKVAVTAGEELVQKCGSNADYKAQIDFVQKSLPGLKKGISFRSAATRFETAVKAKPVNSGEAFASGKELLAIDGNMVDVAIVLATIGFDGAAANPPVTTYNADAVKYAKDAIKLIEGGAKTEYWGSWDYNFKKTTPAQSKDNTLSYMNYYIGYIMSERQGMKKEALPFLYKSTQYATGTKTIPGVYQMIGDSYKEEFNRLDDERTKLAEEAKKLAGDDPKKKELGDKVKEMLGLQKGYAERMIDAYSRAYNLAGTDKAYKDSLYNTMKVLYNVRFDGKTAGLDAYIASFSSKPLIDPSTSVTPVVETPVAATTTTPTTTATVKETPAKTTGTTKTVEKTVTTATTEGATTKTTTKTTTTKKPAPKKKGTK